MQGWTMEVVESIRSVDLLGHVHEMKKADMEIHYRSVPISRRTLRFPRG